MGLLDRGIQIKTPDQIDGMGEVSAVTARVFAALDVIPES